MTAQRRGRNGYTARRQQQKLQQQRQQLANLTSDEESTDGGSVTRCICGESHNVGLMVQCDQCEVWQHCDCVGLEERDIPDQYYCEECKPENHTLTRLSHGRTRHSYSANGHASSVMDKKVPKRRMTFNSREALMSLEDVLAAKNALEMAQSLSEANETPSVSLDGSQDHHDDKKALKKRKEEATMAGTAGEGEEEGVSHTRSSTISSIGHEMEGIEFTSREPDDRNESGAENSRPSKPKRTGSGRNQKNDEGNSPSSAQARQRSGERRARGASSGRKNNSNSSRRGHVSKPRSRTSTPQPGEGSSAGSPQPSSSILERLSSAARESSPPAKVRYPSARMTISEMNRRAKQILEYISSIQVEMATKDSHSTFKTTLTEASPPSTGSNCSKDCVQPNSPRTYDIQLPDANMDTFKEKRKKPGSIIIPEKTNNDSPSSSLSSASTIPLEESSNTQRPHEDDGEKGTAEEAIERMKLENGSDSAPREQSSLEIMDMLTRELIKFQRRFGTHNHPGRSRQRDHDDATSDNESRVTRSRDASASSHNLMPEKHAAHA